MSRFFFTILLPILFSGCTASYIAIRHISHSIDATVPVIWFLREKGKFYLNDDTTFVNLLRHHGVDSEEDITLKKEVSGCVIDSCWFSNIEIQVAGSSTISFYLRKLSVGDSVLSDPIQVRDGELNLSIEDDTVGVTVECEMHILCNAVLNENNIMKTTKWEYSLRLWKERLYVDRGRQLRLN